MRAIRQFDRIRIPNHALVATLAWLAIVVVLKYDTLFAPPVWDTVTGVFPPALYLYLNGFDIGSLMQEQTWRHGGPNVHSLSLVTWVIAVVMRITGDPDAVFLVLHTLTYVTTAYGLMVYTRMVQGFGFSDTVAIASGLFMLLFPVVLVQTGYMYTEIPVLVCCIVAVNLWQRDRVDPAIGVCVLALFIKFTAVVLAASMILVLVATPATGRIRRLARLGVLVLAVLVARFLPRWMGRPESGVGWGDSELLLGQLEARIQAVPDLAWLVIAAAFAGMVLLALGALQGHRTKSDIDIGAASQAKWLCLLFPGVFCAAIVMGAHTQTLLLPRYLVPVIPFALLAVLFLIRLVALQRLALPLLLVSALYFVANYNGRYYPPNYDSFSVVERSHAYQAFNSVKAGAIAALAEHPPELEVWVTREIWYMVSHPLMGYIDAVNPNVYPVFVHPWQRALLSQYPDHFLLLKASTIHGGRTIDRLVKKAMDTGSHEVSSRVFEQDGFSTTLYELKRRQG